MDESSAAILKRDAVGRVVMPRAKREVLLDEFEPEAFAMLTDGIDMHGARPRGWYER